MNTITEAFREASTRLGFSFQPSFAIRLSDGRDVETLGLVPDFGSPRGAVLIPRSFEFESQVREAVAKQGYFLSVLFPSYELYEESLFKDTLNDWQFFGDPSRRPSWYTGQPWS